MRKILLFMALLFLSFLFFVEVRALNAVPAPLEGFEGDNRCWTREQCEQVRMKKWDMSQEKAGAGFYQGTDSALACEGNKDEKNNDVGFCSAAGPATTEISFGGKNTFEHLGEFIKYMYRYAVWAAGILAVALLMVAGFQWMTAGGNAEKVTGARKRIGNALMGLFLAVASYMVLNLMNPYLVNLRLPQVWMINEAKEGEAGAFCHLDDEDGSRTMCEKQGRVCMPLTIAEGTAWETGGSCVTAMRIFGEAMALLAAGGAKVPKGSTPSLPNEFVVPGPFQNVLDPILMAKQPAASWVSRMLTSGKATVKKIILPAENASTKAKVWKYVKVGSVPVILGADQYYTDGFVRNTAMGAVVGTAELGWEAVWFPVKKLFKGNKAGVCMPAPTGLQPGDFCDPDIKNENQCLNGKCVEAADAAVAKCFTTNKTGFCSTGLNNAYCREDNNCANNFGCAVYFDANLGIGYDVKVCTDSLEGSACDDNHNCLSKESVELECFKNRCTKQENILVPLYDSCVSKENCKQGSGGSGATTCYAVQFPLPSEIDCLITTIKQGTVKKGICGHLISTSNEEKNNIEAALVNVNLVPDDCEKFHW